MSTDVRYQVVAPVFVNGARLRPTGRDPVYVMAAPGLEGTALVLAPEGTKPVRPKEATVAPVMTNMPEPKTPTAAPPRRSA